MAALVQAYPQQSGTVAMLQTRNGSGSGMLPSPAQTGQQYGGSQQQRNVYAGIPGGMGNAMGYRGGSGPVQPYAFTATPSLNSAGPWQQHGAYRASSSSAVPTMQTLDPYINGPGRSRHSANASMSNLPNPSMGIGVGGSRDDSALPAPGSRRVNSGPRPQSTYLASTMAPLPPSQVAPAKSSPERYRRPASRVVEAPAPSHQQTHSQSSAQPSGSGMATVNHLYTSRPGPDMTRKQQNPALVNRPNSFYATVPGSVDDMQLYRPHSQEEAKRFRRRSMPTLDSADFPTLTKSHGSKRPEESTRTTTQSPSKTADTKDQIKTARLVTISNASAANARNGSSESLVSSRSSNSRPSSSANRSNVSTPTGNPAQLSTGSSDQNSSNQDYPKLVNIPPRSSSSDATKRVANPSPLSKPVTMDTEAEPSGSAHPKSDATKPPAEPAVSPSTTTTYDSPAVKQLAAINQKGGKLKSKTSRLRRAFSFGSAAEFRKAGGSDASHDHGHQTTAGSKLHKDPSADDLNDAEQARIAQQQEAAGIGHNIYAGSRLFSGSTDNLSISSTASSASIMIRKMGRGMKKGGRSLVGLFRPKSMIGAHHAAEPTIPEVGQAAVSMITVEAERERVNVNPDPHSQNGGGTGFPRLERNSLDASSATASVVPERAGSSGTDNSNPRKSIVGGDKERAEVLAAVRKGILKHTNTGSSSPSSRPGEGNGPQFNLPGVPHVSDSPISSAPSTPNDDPNGQKHNGSVAIGNEDYFVTALRLRQDTKSAPTTPHGAVKRNATFSPRIVFYDTWPSQEYDRRGEIATCNRLTPMLAQQIKEELNSFKMEMEVHENSKIYTHFF